MSGKKNVIKDLTFFKTPSDFRNWLEKYHSVARELWIGFYKKDSGKPSITATEAIREAICFGWIDGIRKSIDEVSYTNRYTPRRPKSNWSEINIKIVKELKKQGLMKPAGLKAYEARQEKRSGVYSYEQRNLDFEEPYNSQFKQNKKAWEFFNSQSATYRKAAN